MAGEKKGWDGMVPEQHQFAELAEALTPRERAALTPWLEELLLRFDAQGEIPEPSLKAFLAACQAAQEADAAAVRQLQAWRWLERQRGVDEAFRSLDRSWRRRTSGVCWEPVSQTQRSPDQERQHLRWQLQRERDRIAPEQAARRALPEAYAKYFHRDSPAQLRAALAHWDQINAALAVAEHHLAALVNQCAEPDTAHSAESTLRLIRRRHTLSINKPLATLRGISPVIHRKDGMARERLLAFHLWSGLTKTANRPGASALAHLLSVDGVDHCLDQRTLERLIAGWSASQITPVQNPPAH
jgi:hypothetical protein